MSLLTNELEVFAFQGTTSAVLDACTSLASGHAAQPIAVAVCVTLCTVVVQADAAISACPSDWIHTDTAKALEAGGAGVAGATRPAVWDDGAATSAIDAHVWALAGVTGGTSPAERDERVATFTIHAHVWGLAGVAGGTSSAERDEHLRADPVDAFQALGTGVPDREVARTTQSDAGAPLDGSRAYSVDAVQAVGAEVELAAHAALADVGVDTGAVDAFQACLANRPDEDVVAASSALAGGHLRGALCDLLLAHPVHARALPVAIGVLVAAGPAVGALHAHIFVFVLFVIGR